MKADREDVEQGQQENKAKGRIGLLSMLLRVTSKPWLSAIRPRHAKPEGDSMAVHPSGGVEPPSIEQRRVDSVGQELSCLERKSYMQAAGRLLEPKGPSSSAIQNIPIASVSLKAAAECPRITARATSMWVTIDAYVDVNSVESFDLGNSRPLDVIIIFDHV